MTPKNLYELCTMLRAEVTAASLQIYAIKVKPLKDGKWSAEYEAEGYRQEQYAEQFQQLVTPMQAQYYFKASR